MAIISNEKNFSNAKIYCIRNYETDDIYTGSSCQKLCKRFQAHKRSMKSTRDSNMLLYQKMKEIGKQHFFIELYQDWPCENIEQLRKREGEVIRELKPTLNKRIEGRTAKEYKEDNKEKLQQWNKQYRDEHKEELKEYNTNYREENKEVLSKKKKEKYENNKEHYKQYREENKDKAKVYRSKVIKCQCGVCFTQGHKMRHFTSKHHQNYEQSLNRNND